MNGIIINERRVRAWTKQNTTQLQGGRWSGADRIANTKVINHCPEMNHPDGLFFFFWISRLIYLFYIFFFLEDANLIKIG